MSPRVTGPVKSKLSLVGRNKRTLEKEEEFGVSERPPGLRLGGKSVNLTSCVFCPHHPVNTVHRDSVPGDPNYHRPDPRPVPWLKPKTCGRVPVGLGGTHRRRDYSPYTTEVERTHYLVRRRVTGSGTRPPYRRILPIRLPSSLYPSSSRPRSDQKTRKVLTVHLP